MKKWKVQRRATLWCETRVEAETEEDALRIAREDESVWEFSEELTESFAWDDEVGLWISGEVR
jgi:hypothetical protein